MEYEQFTANSNDAIAINLVRDGKDVFEEPFIPVLTYTIFGNEELIVGYKNPKINLNFRAHDMKPTVKISYTQRIKPDSKEAEELMDIEGKLEAFLPAGALGLEEAEAGASSTTTDETPPGERIHKYRDDGLDFEVWRASLADPRAYEILNNMKILIPMFIEGGTIGYLDDANDETNKWSMDRWKLFLLYQVHDNHYTLAGFATSYRLWVFPASCVLEALPQDIPIPSPELPEEPTSAAVSDVLSFASRERIAQFIILPPFQHLSHGVQLYNTATAQFLADPYVFEITVEDPNEHFDNLRDYCDLSRLEALPLFSSLKLPTSIPTESLQPKAHVPVELLLPHETLTTLRQSQKLTDRQIKRLIEMHLLGQISPAHRNTNRITKKAASADPQDRAYYFWRLLVKLRVYERNKDELKQMDESERVGRVEESVSSLQESYEALLRGYARRVEAGQLGQEAKRSLEVVERTNTNGRKRKVIVDDSEEDEDDVAPPAAKRPATQLGLR